jgi:hypothetical protein
MWTVNGAPIGGIMALPPEAAGAPPHWLAYIGVRDVDEAARRASDLGATVHVSPQDIPDVGRFAVLADPQGASFAIYAPGSNPGDEQEFQVGQVSWHELLTTDSDAAQRFYFELFGWSITDTFDMGPMGVYAMYGRNGRTYGGIFNKPADMPAPPHWLLYVRVQDLEAAIERAKKAGGQLLFGPEEVPGGDRIAHLMDPQGGAFALHETKKG